MIYVQILLCNPPSLLYLLWVHGVPVLQMGPGKKEQSISNQCISCYLELFLIPDQFSIKKCNIWLVNL